MTMPHPDSQGLDHHTGMIHPRFESLVQRIIQTVDRESLTELRKDFHTRLRITLNQPDRGDLIEDLWDFFYDWCIFEQKLPDSIESLSEAERQIWNEVKDKHLRGLFSVKSVADETIKIKELYLGKTFLVQRKRSSDFLGISRGDMIEVRIIPSPDEADSKTYCFVRRPSYHATEVHDYIRLKVKQLKKLKDPISYQSWLWLLVGMYLKHRIYHHMPIEKIYDDNSRI